MNLDGLWYAIDYTTDSFLVPLRETGMYQTALHYMTGLPLAASRYVVVERPVVKPAVQRSAQTIVIDGVKRSDLSVFNIGGNNYFKLRDLGTALGFGVDYDAATNTAVVTAK